MLPVAGVKDAHKINKQKAGTKTLKDFTMEAGRNDSEADIYWLLKAKDERLMTTLGLK